VVVEGDQEEAVLVEVEEEDLLEVEEEHQEEVVLVEVVDNQVEVLEEEIMEEEDLKDDKVYYILFDHH